MSAASGGIRLAEARLTAVAGGVASGSMDPALAVQSEFQLSDNVQADAAIIATEKTMLGVIIDMRI